MKYTIALLTVVFLSSCSVYTITNKTDQNFTINKSGGGSVNIPPYACLEFNEYFMGLGGDFPFAVEGIKGEHIASHYEIMLKNNDGNTEDEESSTNYLVTESEENTQCTKEGEKESEITALVPICGEVSGTIKAQCATGSARCKKEDLKDVPVCVDGKNNVLANLPTCSDKSQKPNCRNTEAKEQPVLDNNSQVFCQGEKGVPACSDGDVKCIISNKKEDPSSPVCFKNGDVMGNISPACSDNSKAICLGSVVALPNPTHQIKCGNSLTSAQCAGFTNPICAINNTGLGIKPYCVFSTNNQLRKYSNQVTCGNGATPSCVRATP